VHGSSSVTLFSGVKYDLKTQDQLPSNKRRAVPKHGIYIRLRTKNSLQRSDRTSRRFAHCYPNSRKWSVLQHAPGSWPEWSQLYKPTKRIRYTNQRSAGSGQYNDTRTVTGPNGGTYTSQRSAQLGQFDSTKTAVGPNGGVYADQRNATNGQISNSRTIMPAPQP
jgi:hypothetical protein